VEDLRRILEIEPAVVAHDLHPDYLSTRYALEMKNVRGVAVQHHHAHIAAVLAERREPGPVIGVALDGTGYGADGAIWGGEFLIADLKGFRRAGHLAPMPLPGGDSAIREPWRTATAYLYTAFGPEWEKLPIPFVKRIDASRARVIAEMIERHVNTPITSSAGRLFDAVASLLGLCDRNTHEGQAPMELEAAALPQIATVLPCDIRAENGILLMDPASLIRGVAHRLAEDIPPPVISAEFHNGFCRGVVELCERLRAQERLFTVALSGGVFQNVRLFEAVVADLERKQFRVLTHDLVPPNDGCIALGQAAVARAMVEV
jgi:hydrogenase maturation protein HypF